VPAALGMPRDKRCLFLVHRDELAYQACEKFERCNPALTIGLEKASSRAGDADIVVASIQTIAREARLRRFNPDTFLVVQADEAHHIAGSQLWFSVLRYFHVLKGEPDENHGRLLLGWTATQHRSDNVGLECVFDEIVSSYEIREAITDQWLAPIIAYRVETEIDIAKVRTRRGDFDVSDLESTINTAERNELIAQKYGELCPGRPAIFFTADVKHSNDLAETLCSYGFNAWAVSGKTPREERARLIAGFRAGEIHALCSCGVLNEGTDLPNAEAGFMCRPTKSGLLYRQQIGRILRPSPSPEELELMGLRGEKPEYIKPNALIVDVCDLSGKYELIAAPSLVGLPSVWDAQGKSLIEEADEVERLGRRHPGHNFHVMAANNIDALNTFLCRLDLLKEPETPAEIRRISSLSWVKESEGVYRLSLPSGVMFSVRQDALGHYDAYEHVNGIRRKVCTEPDLTSSIGRIENELSDNDLVIADRHAYWKRQPPTADQVKYLYSLDPEQHKLFHDTNEMLAFYVEQCRRGVTACSRGAVSERIDALKRSTDFGESRKDLPGKGLQELRTLVNSIATRNGGSITHDRQFTG
jgi:Type III restriction enzyme, res subunit/Helicase conserved C-terminal domain